MKVQIEKTSKPIKLWTVVSWILVLWFTLCINGQIESQEQKEFYVSMLIISMVSLLLSKLTKWWHHS